MRAPVPAAQRWTSGLRLVRGPNGSALPVDRHHLLVPDDPGIVSGRQRGDLTGSGVEFGAVGHDDVHVPAELVLLVRRHAQVGSGYGLHVLRPPPTRLHGDPAHLRTTGEV